MIKNYKEFNMDESMSWDDYSKNKEFNMDESMSWDDYSKNKEFMLFYNKIKNKILELFVDYKQPILENLIDTIYWCYSEKYSVIDTINYLHTNGMLYDFYVVTDQ